MIINWIKVQDGAVIQRKQRKNNVCNDLSTVKRVQMQIFRTFVPGKFLSQQYWFVKSNNNGKAWYYVNIIREWYYGGL